MVRVFCEHAPGFRFKMVYAPVAHSFTCPCCGNCVSAELATHYALTAGPSLPTALALDIAGTDVVVAQDLSGITAEFATRVDVEDDPWL